MPRATRSPAFRHLRLFLTLGGSTKSQLHHAAEGGRRRTTEGQKSKMKPRQSTSILTPTDGRTAHMSGGGERREERPHVDKEAGVL